MLFQVTDSGLTYAQLTYWKNSATLYGHAINVTQNNWIALTNYGSVLNKQGKSAEALAYFQEALRIKPDEVIYNDMGNAYWHLNFLDKAVGAYKEAIRLKPDFKEAHNNLGFLYLDMGKKQLAINEYN